MNRSLKSARPDSSTYSTSRRIEYASARSRRLSAVRIGLVPKLALPRIVSAGNVAGEGAKIAALSLRERAEAYSILREVEYVELSGRADFNDLFIDQLAFPG